MTNFLSEKWIIDDIWEVRSLPMNEIDEKILGEYLRDSQQSYREIARKLGVSAGTVVSRTRKLEKEGVIKGYTVQLDYEKLGYDLTVITEVTVSKGEIKDVGAEITKLKQACAVYNVTGESDVMVIAKFKTRKELSDFTKRILKIPNVERTNTHLVLITLKEDFRLQ